MEERNRVDLLVCAATLPELQCFARDQVPNGMQEGDLEHGDGVAFLLSGAGIPATLGRLFPALERIRPRRMLNIGIAGAYPGSALAIGDIVLGETDIYGDVGFELPEEPGFRFVGDAPWGEAFYGEAFRLSLDAEFRRAPAQISRGCTVNTCTGTEATGRLRRERFGADFETMEGAAAAQAGAQFGIPVCQVRAISNIASRRDMRPENIASALASLSRYFENCREQ